MTKNLITKEKPLQQQRNRTSEVWYNNTVTKERHHYKEETANGVDLSAPCLAKDSAYAFSEPPNML